MVLDERGTELDSEGIAQLIARVRRCPLGAPFLCSTFHHFNAFVLVNINLQSLENMLRECRGFWSSPSCSAGSLFTV